MGIYVNPGNKAFSRINNSKYVDKTMLIDLINQTIDGDACLTCVSRPRRFGKSYAARMLTAYYDCSCKSDALFNDKEIAKTEHYKDHMNKYNVIRLDISTFTSVASREGIPLEEVPNMIVSALKEDLLEMMPDFPSNASLLRLMMRCITMPDGKPFVFIIDEWDAIIREGKKNEKAQKRFLALIREWFKNETFTPYAVAAAYLTGILPIKKGDDQTATSDFKEYSILHPGPMAPFFGFNEEEVKHVCDKYSMDFDTVQQWYDGYTVGPLNSVYNPYSVMWAAGETYDRYRSYWRNTTARETLRDFIDIDLDGLQEAVARLMAGESIEVNTELFENDLSSFKSKDDVLTLLIHLGYLSYERHQLYEGGPSTVVARIPNMEARLEFESILRNARHKTLVEFVRKSDQLLKDVLAGREDAVAKVIHDVHDSNYAPTFYNHEQALRSVIRLACISWSDQYGKVEELPSGHGLADIAFIPKRDNANKLPGIIFELKWDQCEEGAIYQIKKNNYPKVLEQFESEVELVGVNYDSEDKVHTCKIEHMRK